MDAAQERMARLRRRGRIFRWAGALFEACVGLAVVFFLAWASRREGGLDAVREDLAGWDWILLVLMPLLEPVLTLSVLGAEFLGLTGIGRLAFTLAVFAAWGWALFGMLWFVGLHILDLDRAIPHARRRWRARLQRWSGRGRA